MSVEELSEKPSWLKLLYYDKSLTGYESQIDSKEFFLKSGTQPLLELQTFVDSLKSDRHIRCQYPARTKLVVKELGLEKKYLNFSHCQKYLDFYQFMLPEKVYLVFSSYFLESPGSAFGHTFLRFSKKSDLQEGQRGELLDLGINYGADVTTDNAILYSLFGIIGGFDGIYSSMPYYYKVREYNNFESRDLWSYELNLSLKDKEKLVDHLWELSPTRSAYYFFTENCSYRVLKALEAVKPNIDILDGLPFFVIPADTIKELSKESNLVKEIHFRPSIKRVFENIYKQLDQKEKKSLDSFIDSKDFKELSSLSESSKANVLDVALEFIDFKHSSEVLAKKGEFYDFKKEILKKRAKLPGMELSTEVPMPQKEKPHLGHQSQRFGIKYGDNKELGSYEELEVRMAFHDLLDPVIGQPELAEITFFSLRGRFFNDTESLQFERWTLAEISTLNPVGFKHYPLSLSARIGVERVRNATCDNCLAPLLMFGTGLTKSFSSHRYLFSFYLDNEVSQDDSYVKSHFRYSVGPRAQALLRWTPSFNQKLSAGWQKHIFQELDDWSANHTARYHLSKRFSVEVKNNFMDTYEEHQVSLLTFF